MDLPACFHLAFCILLALFALLSAAQESKKLNNLREIIAKSLKCHHNPGMTVSIVKNGQTVFSEGFGVITRGSSVKVTPDTRFVIASLTKAFTAALLVNVFANNPQNKSFSLSMPLREVVGRDDFVFADEERTKYASAEDLLSHRIGLPDQQFPRLNADVKRPQFLKLARYWKSNLPFRGTSKYSSVAYTLAAAITELMGSPQSWEDLLTERLLKPLDLNSTGFAFTTDFNADNVAKPYSTYQGMDTPIWPVFTRVFNSRCGSGCILSTAEDMAKWMNFILSGGRNAAGHQVLPEDEVKTLTKIRTYLKSYSNDLVSKPVFPVTNIADTYALGWRRGLYRGYHTLSHTGSTPGYASMIMIYPAENLGIYIAMNGDDEHNYYRLPLVQFISDTMLGLPPWLNTSTICSFPAPWAKAKNTPAADYDTGIKPSLPYIDYIGAYKNDLYGEAFVNFNSSTFLLQGFYGVGSWELFAQKEKNVFYGKGIWATNSWDIPNWEFQTDENNPRNVTKLVIHGFYPKDPPVFEKEINNQV